MAYHTIEDELLRTAELEQMRKTVKRLIAETEELTIQLKYAREKMIEAQERNRKLDWLLTKAVEKL